MQQLTIEINASIKRHFNQLITASDVVLNRQAIQNSLEKINSLYQTREDDTLLKHLSDLTSMIHMLSDPDWQMPADKAQRINAALAYFLNEDDIIPDSTPGLGYLDDCIVINNTKEYLDRELQDFTDFQNTRRVYGKNKCHNRTEWAKIKQQETASRLRHRRSKLSVNN